MKANNALIFSRLSLLTVAAAASLGAMAPSKIDSLQLTTAKGRSIRVSHWRTHGCRNGSILSSHGNLSSLWKYKWLLWRLLFTAAGVLMSGVLAQAIIQCAGCGQHGYKATSETLGILCPTALTIAFLFARQASRLARHPFAEPGGQTLAVRDASRGSARISRRHVHCERGRITGR